MKSSLERFIEFGGDKIDDPLERLRIFCSIALSKEDLDPAEKLFDGVRSGYIQKIKREHDNYCKKCGYHFKYHDFGVPEPQCPNKSEIKVNYVVHINDAHGYRKVTCNTEKEAWDAIGKSTFGGLYEVSSPNGLDVSDFIPY